MGLQLEDLVTNLEELPERIAPWLQSWLALNADEREWVAGNLEWIVRATAERLESEAPEIRARYVDRVNVCLTRLAGQTHPLFADVQSALGALREAIK